MVQNLRRERLQEDRESKCISARSVALPLKRNFAYWGALWGRHWGFMQLPVFRHKASSPHNAGRWHLPLSAHTFLRAAASSHRSSWVAEWKSSYLKKKVLIRFYEANGAGPWGGGERWCMPPDWWSLITLRWAGFLVLGPFYPWDTPQHFHDLAGDRALVRTVNSLR